MVSLITSTYLSGIGFLPVFGLKGVAIEDSPLSSDWASRFFTNRQKPLATRVLGGVLDQILPSIVVEY